MAVMALVVLGQLGPGTPTASAGFDCKDVPMPEYPRAATPTWFDTAAGTRAAPTGENPTGYQTYGWAGLRWYTYDLGCGPDIVRAPFVVKDTEYGNDFLMLGESMAAAAFWLDDQTKTGTQAEAAGTPSALAQFDKIVLTLSAGLSNVYIWFLGFSLVAVAAMLMWSSLRANAAALTRTSAVALAGLTVGAFLVGAPAKAIEFCDETFGSVITETQDQIFSASISEDGGTLGSGTYDPRNVMMDRILLEDWRKGWFGANYDDSQNQLGPKLRESLAFSYAEQQAIDNAPLEYAPAIGFLGNAVELQLVQQKQAIFRDEIVKPLEAYNLSYHTFQGKNLGRANTGAMAAFKLSLPSILWIGASLLKLLALLSIRFAILFAPIWVPLAIAHGGLLARVFRMLATAYMWGVVGAVVVALYLMAMVRLYNTDGVDGTWRMWFLLILSVVCWFIMRPFKRISQTLTQNQASVLNRKVRVHQGTMRRALLRGAGALIGGPAGAAVAQTGGGRGPGRIPDGGEGGSPAARPEGRGLDQRRRAVVSSQRLALQRHQRVQLGAGEERDARIASIAALASSPRALPAGAQASKEDAEASHAAELAVAARRRLDQKAEQEAKDGAKARHPAIGVGKRWDGGDSSTIAPMVVYTSTRFGTQRTFVAPPVRKALPAGPSSRVDSGAKSVSKAVARQERLGE